MKFSAFALTLLSLALPLTSSASHSPVLNRHRDVAHRARGDVNLHKRFDGARFTYYSTGLGSCGVVNNDGDFIVALNVAQYGDGYPGPNCFKSITISANGKTTTAQITDECPGCPYGGLDLSPGLFNFFADFSAGVLTGTWFFNDGAPAPAPAPTPTSTYSPPPAPTPSSTSTPTPSSTVATSSSAASSSAATSSSAVASSASSSSSSTSANPTPLAVSKGDGTTYTGAQNLANVNQAVINMGGMLTNAAGA